jgi:hypothetical protein
MAAFHEVLFPLDIALKSAGGPERRTEIVATGSGAEERNARWAHSRRRTSCSDGSAMRRCARPPYMAMSADPKSEALPNGFGLLGESPGSVNLV